MIEEYVTRRFEQPDEALELALGRLEIVELAGTALGRATYEPGWRWSEHVGQSPEERCQSEHLGMVLSGSMGVRGPDYEGVIGAGELFAIPPDHDAWVVGEEPYVSLHLRGIERYLADARGRS